MIYHLQKKVIRICGISVFLVFSAIFALIFSIGKNQLNQAMDALTDRISENNGIFPEFEGDGPFPKMGKMPDFMTEETPFATRFFTVCFDEKGNIAKADIEFVSSVTETLAGEYGAEAYRRGKERGWMENYRYKMYEGELGKTVVFVDGSMSRFMFQRVLLAAGIVLVVSMVIIWLAAVVFSRRAVKPMAESFEKQKQFITDANHELKTPLTLILTNLDILEAEVGKNEWLSDIRSEGERMNALVNQLVLLARMDEDRSNLDCRMFSLSDMVKEAVSEFQMMAEYRGKQLTARIAPGIRYRGDETSIHRVIWILLDNAVKYCDKAGRIHVVLEERKHPVLYVENTYANVENIRLERLFDRFYREDKARTSPGGFGIGLAIAKAIVNEISMSEAVVDVLTYHKYNVDAVYDGADALAYAEAEQYDGMILDIMMPELSGLEVLEQLRKKGNNTPILLLTAKVEIEDRIQGLDMGADDYLPKPFAMGELLARVRAMLRRKENFTPDILKVGNLTLNMQSYELSCNGQSFVLPKLEYQLMELLMLNKGIYLSTEDLLTKVWGYETNAELGTVWVYISYLRKRLTALSANVAIRVKRNVGYTLEIEG